MSDQNPQPPEPSSGRTVVIQSQRADAENMAMEKRADALTMTKDRPLDLAPVMTREVLQYAKPKCRACAGTGKITQLLPSQVAQVVKEPKPGQPTTVFVNEFQRRLAVCGCAIPRFMKQNPSVVYDRKSGGYFRPI